MRVGISQPMNWSTYSKYSPLDQKSIIYSSGKSSFRVHNRTESHYSFLSLSDILVIKTSFPQTIWHCFSKQNRGWVLSLNPCSDLHRLIRCQKWHARNVQRSFKNLNLLPKRSIWVISVLMVSERQVAKRTEYDVCSGFTNYLLSSECDIFNPNNRSVCQEMDHPLNHYFIAASHNT